MASFAPLRVLVAGDFSGKATGKLLRIDRDNLETTLREFSPKVEVALGNAPMGDAQLVFQALRDFEPDRIYETNEIFAPLRDESGHPLYSEPDEDARTDATLKPTAEQIARLTSPGGLLDAIVEKSSTSRESGAAAPAPKRVDEFEAMVERIVAPYRTAGESADSKQAALERTQRISLVLRRILHDPEFQAFEAAWRGLDLLVRGLDTDEQIHLYLFDISKEKMVLDLKANGDIRATVVFRALAADTDERWGLIAANLCFDRDFAQDVEMLERVSSLAQALGAPLIAEWQTSPREDDKAEEAWQALRKTPAAEYLALALPRFLLRLPYGKDTVTMEGLEFEEMVGEPEHNEYLWGNPAFACAFVLGKLFERQGSLSPIPGYLRLGDLPLHIVETNGTRQTRPCTEVLLSEHDCELLLEEGVLPLAGVKGADQIVFPRMQSVAEGGKLLAGLQAVRW